MSLENLRVVLVGPIYGGNVGAVCRAMANMGLSDLALVAPRNLNMDEARMMACHATDILDGRSEFATVAEAVADCRLVMGTTVRMGLYRQHARSRWQRTSRTVARRHKWHGASAPTAAKGGALTKYLLTEPQSVN